MLIIPASFASDNSTDLSSNQPESVDVLAVSVGDDLLHAPDDYYFDASAEKDGNGTLESPYKYLKSQRITSNCNIHLANGKYELDTSKSVQTVNIIGSDVEKTIISYTGKGFIVSSSLTLQNVTLVNCAIENRGTLTATNTIFSEGTGYAGSGKIYGGAIYSYDSNDAVVTASNCTFTDNSAGYGGAIYMTNGYLNVFDSVFIGNTAQGYGGAITTLNTTVSLNDVDFTNCSAKWDGGAIYHMYGNFTLTSSTFINNQAINGGALFIVKSESLNIKRNGFYFNNASCAGAVYSLLNYDDDLDKENDFLGNTAEANNDTYITWEFNLNIGNGNYTMYKISSTSTDDLPSRYSLLDEGQLTDAKDQGSSGNCWAFPPLTALESCILKIANVTYDFSEENIKNLMTTYSVYGWNNYNWAPIRTNDGGINEMALGYLLSWLGPINEDDDPYDAASTLSHVFDSIVHVQNVAFLSRDNYTDNDGIKKALVEYGAVVTPMCFLNSYFNTKTNAYCCVDSKSRNHAVAIIGWDDNYSKSNFRNSDKIEGDGAWIVRNSWGSNWGDNGNFYVSYYDQTLAKPNSEVSLAFILNDTVKFDKNYQYDIPGRTDYLYNTTSSVIYKNVFTSTDDEFLAAVSTYFEKTTNWTVSIIVNNESKAIKSGNFNPGYYTINLNEMVPLKKGDVFEVIFNITVDGNAGFPISEKVMANNFINRSGISYASWDGETWFDLYDFEFSALSHSYASQVACIKAFTILNPIETALSLNISNISGNCKDITVTVSDQYGNLLNYGNVTFAINDVEYVVNVSEGIAQMDYVFDRVSNSVSAIFDATGYSSSYLEDTVEFTKTKFDLDLEISQVLNEAVLDISCSDNINATLIIYVNDKQSESRLTNGKTTLTLSNLSNGVYKVNVTFPDSSIYESDNLEDSFEVNVSRTQIIAEDLTFSEKEVGIFNVTLTDEAKNPLSNYLIYIYIGNYTFSGLTDENGHYAIPLLLDNGEYPCYAEFKGDNNHFNSNASVTVHVEKVVKNPSQILIDVGDVSICEDVDVSITVLNASGDVLVMLDGSGRRISLDDDGVAGFVIEKIAAGKHILDVVYLGSDLNEMANASEVIYASKLASEINMTIGDIKIGTETQIDIEIPGASGEVYVYIDGVESVNKLTDGKTSLNASGLAVGNHNIDVIYPGDDIHDFASANKFIPASAVSTRFTNITVSGKGMISAVLVDGFEKVIADAKISYRIGDSNYTTFTSQNGEFTIYINSNAVVRIAYEGDDLILPTDLSVTVNVQLPTRMSTSIVGDNYTQPAIEYYGGERGGNFTVQLVDQNGKAMANKVVYIGYNGKCLQRTTDANGYANVQINLVAENRLTFAVVFLGDDDYNATMSVYLITITKKSVTVTAPAKTYKATAKTKSYTVTLKTDPNQFDGKTYFGAGKKVTMTLNGITYTAKTDSKGQATFKLSITKKGTYSATVQYAGDNTYKSAKATAKITIK